MYRSALYAANTANQALTANSTINFGTIVRRFEKSMNVSGGNLVIKGAGLYDIDTNISFIAGGTGTNVITVYLLKDGIPIPGAMARLSATSGNNYTICIPTMVKLSCCCESAITAVINADATIVNAAIVAEKI